MNDRPPGPSRMNPEVMVHIDALRDLLLGREVTDAAGDRATVDELIIHKDGDDLSAEVVYRDRVGPGIMAARGAIIFRNVHTLRLAEEVPDAAAQS